MGKNTHIMPWHGYESCEKPDDWRKHIWYYTGCRRYWSATRLAHQGMHGLREAIRRLGVGAKIKRRLDEFQFHQLKAFA